MKITTEKLTPEIAQQWLDTVTDKQRKRRKQHVEYLADIMRNHRWFEGHPDPFVFIKGHLMNGQHRCEAVILSGVTIEVTVWRDADPNLFPVLDGDLMPRKLHERITVMPDYSQNVKCLEIVGFGVNCNEGIFAKSKRVTPDAAIKLFKENKPALVWLMSTDKKFFSVRGIGHSATLWALIGYFRRNQEKCKSFWSALTDRESTVQQAQALRDYFMTHTLNGGGTGRMDTYLRSAWCMKCHMVNIPVGKVYARGWGEE